MGTVIGAGSRGASATPYPATDPEFTARSVEVLAEHDDGLLAAYVHDEASLSPQRLRAALADQTRQALVHPVFFGSAITGAGVAALTAGIRDLLAHPGDAATTGPVSGTVFKVERGPAGERIAYVRMFSGTLRVRDRIQLHRAGGHREAKVTAVQVFANGAAQPQPTVVAGQIGKVWGLGPVRIGDPVGVPPATHQHHFSPPTLETVVVASRPADKHALHTALTQLAEQDPLINLRRDGIRQEVSVSLYGEVQKEVIQATLADEYGVDVSFLASSTLCVERPVGPGEAVELLQEEANPFRATIGLRIEPARPGTGVEFRLRVDPRTVPTHLYRSVDGFTEMMGRYARGTLQEGLAGWQVTDCVVTMTRCAYSVADGPPSMRGPDSTTADFRKLTPLVVMAALQQAGTRVNEPIHRYHLEVPADTLGAVLPALARLAAAPQAPVAGGAGYLLTGDIPAAQVHALQQRLSGLTRGEAVLEASFDHYRPVRGPVPTRPRTDHNPLDRKQYLLHVLRRV